MHNRTRIVKHALVMFLIGLLGAGVWPVTAAPPSQTGLPPLEKITAANVTRLVEIATLDHQHRREVYSVAFDMRHPLLATGDYSGAIRLWQIEQGVNIQVLRGHDYGVYDLAFSPRNNVLASGGWDGSVRIWDTFGGAQVYDLRLHHEPVYSVAYSPDGRYLASGGGYQVNAIYEWDADTRQESRFIVHTGWVESVAYSPDGRYLASGSDDNTLRVWDRQDGGQETFAGHEWAVGSVAFNPDGSVLASGSLDGTVRLWDVEAIRQVGVIETGPVWKIAFSPDGTILAAGGRSGDVTFWDAATGANLATLTAHEGWIEDLAFSPDGTLLATAGEDGTARLFGVPADGAAFDGPMVWTGIRVSPAEVHIKKGEQYEAQGDFWAAVQEYGMAAEADPQWSEPFYRLANVYYHGWNDLQQALRYYTDAIEINPDVAMYYLERGSVYYDMRSDRRALDDFNRALELEPDWADTYYRRALVYRRMGDIDAARADLEYALELMPGTPLFQDELNSLLAELDSE